MSIEPCLSQIKKTTVFATTPAEFNLTSRNQPLPDNANDAHSRNRNSVDQSMTHRENISELIRLHSSAFWDLRQSVAENGEGFVRRMRDYEGSRSRQIIHLKVKEAEKRGRKRLSCKKRTVIHNSDDDDEEGEEDIQICSGESSSSIPNFSFPVGGERSLHAMDVDIRQLDSPSTWHMRSCSSCGPQCSSKLQLDLFTPKQEQETEPRFASTTVSSSPNSTPTLSPPGLLSLRTDDLPLLSTPCHKVIASLNLALANGAGSLEDYSSLWEYQSRFQPEYYDQGDLWH